MAKKYYWLKLKKDFFNSKEMKKLRRIAGGDTYTVIYLKMQLVIRITDDEAGHLYNSSTHCFYHEQDERFEYVNKDDEKSNIMDTFDSSHTMHFCDDNIVNAILLKNYFVRTNFKCVILWDMDGESYVVVTNKKWNDYMNKINTDTDKDNDKDNEHFDEKIKINI